MTPPKHKSQTDAEAATDDARGKHSRAMQTRLQIDAAFVALLHRRTYDSLRVSELTKKAGVGRATFYAHFDSKDDLLRSQLQRVVMPMVAAGRVTPLLPDCRRFFEHIRTAPQLFKAIMGGRERAGARVVREAFEWRFDELLGKDARQYHAAVPTPLLRRFVTSTLMTVAKHGLEADQGASAEEMQRLFETLVGPALREIARALD